MISSFPRISHPISLQYVVSCPSPLFIIASCVLSYSGVVVAKPVSPNPAPPPTDPVAWWIVEDSFEGSEAEAEADVLYRELHREIRRIGNIALEGFANAISTLQAGRLGVLVISTPPGPSSRGLMVGLIASFERYITHTQH